MRFPTFSSRGPAADYVLLPSESTDRIDMDQNDTPLNGRVDRDAPMNNPVVVEDGSDLVEFEDILRKIGKWGRTQIIQLTLLALVVVATAFHNMGMVFLAGVPGHHCSVDASQGFSTAASGYVHNSSLPLVDRHGQLIYSECDIFVNTNSTLLSENETRATVPCTEYVGKWTYAKSVYTNTIVSEWDLVCDDKWMGAFSQMVYFLGYFVGCIVVGDLSDRFGRRLTIVACSAIQLAFGIATYFSPTYTAFTILRFFLGVGTGGQRNSAYVLGQEWCTEDMRVPVSVLNGIGWTLGYLLLGGIAYIARDWKIIELATSVPMVIYVLYHWLVLPSPRWLITKGRRDEALEILRTAAQRNGRPLPEQFDLSKITLPQKASTSLIDPLRTPNMRFTTIILWFNWFVVGMAYFGLAYNIGNLSGDVYLNHTFMGLIGFVGAPLGYLVLKIGRRWPLCLSMFFTGISCLLVLAIPNDLSIVTTVLALLGKTGSGLVFGCVYIYASEVYPTSIRTIGLGTGSMWARVGGAIAPYIVLLSDTLNSLPYIIFGASSLIAALFALYLPETHERPLVDTLDEAEKINRLFCRWREPTKLIEEYDTEHCAENTHDNPAHHDSTSL